MVLVAFLKLFDLMTYCRHQIFLNFNSLFPNDFIELHLASILLYFRLLSIRSIIYSCLMLFFVNPMSASSVFVMWLSFLIFLDIETYFFHSSEIIHYRDVYFSFSLSTFKYLLNLKFNITGLGSLKISDPGYVFTNFILS